MKKILILTCITTLAGLSYFFYNSALTQSTYEGLPTVACLDYTRPTTQNFSLFISITIDGKSYPLDATLGHGAGTCLYDIHTNDTSGNVYIQANDNEQFHLGQFFDVWGKAFSDKKIFQYQVANRHSLHILVNGKSVNTYRNTLLHPNQKIDIIYQ